MHDQVDKTVDTFGGPLKGVARAYNLPKLMLEAVLTQNGLPPADCSSLRQAQSV